MAPSVTPRRRVREDEPEDDSSSQSSDASRSSKRHRSAANGTGRGPSTLPNNYLSQDRPSQASRDSRKRMEHQPGSIVRVKLSNFVTYAAVEIFPGPSLNMVIGPNGTGKSTLVCAICLGLGWPPKHLGRQKEYSEFVKNGEREATIEIELQRGQLRSRNPVVRCELKKDGNKADFFINGEKVKAKQVQTMARKYSIQIDNLCQFLPQDKVVEFAAMTPVELLRSTQEAVGSKKMLAWHDELKQIRMEQKQKEDKKIEQEATLKNLESRQRMQEADVARLREREEIKEKVRLWTHVKLFAQFEEAKTKYEEEKARHLAAESALKSLENSLEPTLRAANAKATYRDAIEATVKHRRHLVEEGEAFAQSCAKAVDGLDKEVKELDVREEAERRGGKDTQMERRRLQNTINETRNRLEEPAPDFNAAFHNDRINSHQKKRQEKNTEINELEQKMQKVRGEASEKAVRIKRAEQDLASLDTQAGQQKNKLARASPDTFKLWEWIQQNRQEFEKPVFGPPIIECTVKDPRYVPLMESLFQSSNFLALTTQTKSDFNKVQDLIYKQMRLHNVSVREVTGALERHETPVSRDQMKEYGFDGWALDYLNGPEPVLAMLCEDIKLHQTGMALRDTSDEQYQLLQNSRIVSWATKKSVYRISRRREYGPGAVSTLVRDTRPAQFWTDQPVDPQAKISLKQVISELKDEQTALMNEWQVCKTKREHAVTEHASLEKEINEFKKEKEDSKKLESQYRGLPAKLEHHEQKLAGLEQQMQELRVRINELRAESDEKTLQKGQAAIEYATAAEKLLQLHDDLFEAELAFIEATSDYETLVERNKSVRDQLDAKKLEVQELERGQIESKKQASVLGKQCKRVMSNAEDEGDDRLLVFIRENARSSTTQHVDGELAAEQARLELMHDGDGRIIEEFEARERKIAEIRDRLQAVEAAILESGTRITQIRARWEPRLDNMITRISDSFAFNMKQINCAGEVGIDKDDDFDKWAISIKVKFREEEALTQLDSHRQSGGERAVSTIFYLMSLQTLTRSPFRVVDEINQGMDPRNERLVHSRMVAIATGNDEWFDYYERNLATNNTDVDDGLRDSDAEDENARDTVVPPKAGGSQYFLITPKLLHGLRYEPGMKVLCIASGEFMPDNQTKASFARSLEIRRGMKSISAAG